MRVVFCPGAGGDHRFWQPLERLLPAAWDKVLLDWPGLGDVPPSPDVNGFEDLVRLTLRVIDGPVDLVAQSMGGVVALRVVLEHPELVRRLVLIATSGGVDMRSLGAGDWRGEDARRVPPARTRIIEQRPHLTARPPPGEGPPPLRRGRGDPVN